MREHYKLPTLDDVLPKLANAKIFSRLDVREAYWHVKLDKESSDLTTMITPFKDTVGRDFRLVSKFQAKFFNESLTEALGDIEGVFTIADDIIVAGCGRTNEEALIDNDRKLKKLFQRCNDHNILLNEEKKEVGLTEITFHGHRITREGVKVDDVKVKAIHEMPCPTDVSGVKRLCGMVQYMAKFLPDLANDLAPIRELTKKDVPWIWSDECNMAFQSTHIGLF
ncbi:unnamed protein product [Mytilus coruscus]|uniref:Reverse transcriptase domain-containing protein n=1 Tax=Mytilus coruscus TaxID=42192 RepID=A0A6J8CDG2_MYTCO|nr:unnamed protein product [Mytilus coruscus]